MSGSPRRGGWREGPRGWTRHRSRGSRGRRGLGRRVGEGSRPPSGSVALDGQAPPRECAGKGGGRDYGSARVDFLAPELPEPEGRVRLDEPQSA